jgi:carbon monoxide dehydrogenase subunit G|tara:strand:- start:215 stop:559 length:345 start_codon:yes stop_codon:yes gene_type:complete
MIEPATYNVDAYQGATYTLNMTYKIDNVVVDLTGYTAAMQVRSTPGAPTAILSLESGTEITLGGAAGTIAVEVSATVMAAVAAGNYEYDFDLNSGGQVTRLIRGKFTVVAEITK